MLQIPEEMSGEILSVSETVAEEVMHTDYTEDVDEKRTWRFRRLLGGHHRGGHLRWLMFETILELPWLMCGMDHELNMEVRRLDLGESGVWST